MKPKKLKHYIVFRQARRYKKMLSVALARMLMGVPVRDIKFLHLCWLVEETLNEMESADYAELLRPIDANYKLLYHASWHQRVVALAKAKGVE